MAACSASEVSSCDPREDEAAGVRKVVGINIREVNDALTEVHREYHNLLLKYSKALNVIDDLKCQLACNDYSGAATTIASATRQPCRIEAGAGTTKASATRQPCRIEASNRKSNNVPCSFRPHRASSYVDIPTIPRQELEPAALTSPPSFEDREFRAISRETEFHGNHDDNLAGLQLFTELFPVQELYHSSTSIVSTCSSHDATSSAASEPCCQTQVEKHPDDRKALLYESCDGLEQIQPTTLNKECAIQTKHVLEAQPGYHQIAVVYPARRDIKLCAMGCCGQHSCCCCQHMPHSQRTFHDQNFKTSACAGCIQKQVSRTQPVKNGNPLSASPKILEALSEAAQWGAKLRRSSIDLLHHFK